MSTAAEVNAKAETLIARIDSADAIVKEAKERLENAQSEVATAAACLTEIRSVRIEEGVVVELEGWKELQTAIGAWRTASQNLFEATLRASSAVPPKRGQIRSAHKDLNSKGKGPVCYRMALHEGEFVWFDKHPDIVSDGQRLPGGSLRASERCAETFAEVPEGLIVLEITKHQGEDKRPSHDVGRTFWKAESNRMGVRWNAHANMKHVGVRKEGNTFIHVIEIDGVRQDVRSAS